MELHFRQKLAIPVPAHVLVERPSLLAQLDQAITSKPVVILATAAGWGKTIALHQWAGQQRMPVAWYTLDQRDRDPVVFLGYLLQALTPMIPRGAVLAAQLQEISAAELPTLMQRVALEIAAVPTTFALVLDDVQILEDAPALAGTTLIYELLRVIAAYASHCHLVLSSRVQPAHYDLVRLIVQQRATVFDAQALQFMPKEVQQLARLRYNASLSDDSATQLTGQWSGWIAGIVLLLEQAMQWQAGPTIEGPFDPAPVYDFLAEQIFAKLPADLQRFLEDSSFLEELTPQHCAAVCNTNNAVAFLDEIRRRGLFVVRRGARLSIQPLFRDFLRLRLAQHPLREHGLLRRAGDRYREEGALQRAIDCYLAAGMEEQAIELLRTAVPKLRQRGRRQEWQASFERVAAQLGHPTLRRRLPPDLLLAQAHIANQLGQWGQAELAIRLAEATGDSLTRWEARILMASLLVRWRDQSRAEATLRAVPVGELPARLQLAYYLACGQLQLLGGDNRAALESLEAANALVPDASAETDDMSMFADLYEYLGWAYALHGDRKTARRYLTSADAFWQESGDNGRRATTLNRLGWLVLEEQHYVQAGAAFATGLQLVSGTDQRDEEALLRCSIADLAILEGDLQQALAGFSEAYGLATHLDIPDRSQRAAIGALWAAALLDEGGSTLAWQQIIATQGAIQQSELRGRYALAQLLLLLRRPAPDALVIARLIAEAAAAETALQQPERAYLALVQAALAFAHDGWSAAAARWRRAEQYAAHLPDYLLRCFVLPHEGIVEAAPRASALAHRLGVITPHTTSIRWRMNALGNWVCLVDSEPCVLSALHRTLLVRLLDAGVAGLSLERLWEDVWGNDEISMTALHTALSRLRSQTKLTIVARDGMCAIQSPWEAIDYDVQALEQTLALPVNLQTVQRAMTLYQGDFLLAAVASASRWASARRAYLQQHYLDTLEHFARMITLDNPEQAFHYYQSILRIDGSREQTAAETMRLAARMGKRSLVTMTFEMLQGALQVMGTTPDPMISALFHQLH